MLLSWEQIHIQNHFWVDDFPAETRLVGHDDIKDC